MKIIVICVADVFRILDLCLRGLDINKAQASSSYTVANLLYYSHMEGSDESIASFRKFEITGTVMHFHLPCI